MKLKMVPLLFILFLPIAFFIPLSAQPVPVVEVDWRKLAGQAEETVEQQIFQLFLPLISTAARPSSEELILAAEEAAIIDLETSLLYQFYAMYNDSRLPQQYRGDDRFVIDAAVMQRASLAFSQLSEAGQAALLPFLIPPAYTDSWFEARRNETPREVLHGHGGFEPDPCIGLSGNWTIIERNGLKVWLSDPAQIANAEALVEELNSTIRPALQNLLNVVPLSDAGIECNGGSDSYDIYILPAEVMGYTAGAVGNIQRDLATCMAPSFMVIRDDLPLSSETGYTLFDILAHEYMHTMQRAYDFRACNYDRFSLEGFTLYKWLEATAQWAIDFVYSDSNIEHHNARAYLNTNNVAHNLSNDRGLFFFKNDYDSYLFPFYLTHQAQDSRLIPRLYKSWETYALATEGVDQVINGGLQQRWPEFALYHLNRPPYDFYYQWDQIPHTTRVPINTIGMSAHHPLLRQGEWQQRDFSGEMHRYATVSYESNSGLVVITNMDKVVETESIQLYHFPLNFPLNEGEELPAFQDLSNQKEYAVCLEEAEPKVVGSLFVLTNSEILREIVPVIDKLELKYLAMGCNQWRLQSNMLVESHWIDTEATWDSSTAITATVLFSRTDIIVNGELYGLEFAAASGQLEVAVRGMLQNRIGTTHCAADFTYPVSLQDEAWLNLFIGTTGESVEAGYIGQGITDVSGITWRNCMGQIEEIQGPVDWFYTRDIRNFDHGFAFSGSLTETIPLEDEDGTKTLTHSWALTALPD